MALDNKREEVIGPTSLGLSVKRVQSGRVH